MKDSIIVTGGAGFIGSNLVERLNLEGFRNIYIVDNTRENKFKEKNLQGLHFKDLIEKNFFIKNLNKFKNSKFCFHQGACSDTTELDRKYLMQNNFQYSIELLDFCNTNKIDMVYASSASVYGKNLNFIEEEKYENPINFYAESKLEFDRYVRSQWNNLDIQVTGLRYFNVFGPKEYHKDHMSSVVLKFYQQMLENNTINIFKGSEKFIRDFIYIDDVIDLNMFFLNNKVNGIFNIGTGEPRSFSDIASIFKNINKNIEINEIDFPENLKGQYQEFTKSNNVSLSRHLPGLSFLTLEEGVERYISHLEEYFKNES